MKTACLKTQVEEHLVHLRATNSLLQRTRSGSLTHRQFLDYLNNLMYFFQHSVIHLEIARRHAEARGLTGVVSFLAEKTREEQGHDRWAHADLRKSGSSQESVDLGRVAPATHRILAYSVDLIERDPELFLAYMFYHEYMTVIGGPELLDDLEAACGIPRDHVTAIGHHVTLDRHHVEDDLAEIERVVERTPEKLPLLQATVHETAALAEGLYAGSVSLYY